MEVELEENKCAELVMMSDGDDVMFLERLQLLKERIKSELHLDLVDGSVVATVGAGL